MHPERHDRSTGSAPRARAASIAALGCLFVVVALARVADAQAPRRVDPIADAAERRREAVGLEELLRHAEEHAPAIRVARARLGLGEAALAGARPLLPSNPSLYGGVGPRIQADRRGLDFQASLQQPIEIAGERGRRRVAAERTRDRVRAELEAVRWRVRSEVRAAFEEALVEHERHLVAAQLGAFQERLLEIAENRLRVGDTGQLPVRIARGEAAQARVAAIAAEQAYAASLLRLAEIAGWPRERALEVGGPLLAPRESPPLARLRDLAGRHQAARRILEASTAEARAERDLADREAWPEPSLGVQVSREDEDDARGDLIVLGTLGFELPIFQRNQRARAEARAALEIAEAESQAYSERLERALARAKAEVDAAARRLSVYGTDILPAFAENLELMKRAYELGEMDILEVSVARDRFVRIEVEALVAHADYADAVAALEVLVGADPWGAPPRP